jgi:flagellar basal body rod protein FlgC
MNVHLALVVVAPRLIRVSRSYEDKVEVLNTAETLLLKTLRMGS